MSRTLRLTALMIFLLFDITTVYAQSPSSGFQTPSGNIYCLVEDAGGGSPSLRCDMGQIEAPIPPKPAQCQFDWGRVFTLSARQGSMRICYSDTIADPSLPVLAYGQTWHHLNFTCASDIKGLKCSTPEGHGFFLSRRQQIFLIGK
jgi:hypothetical protein